MQKSKETEGNQSNGKGVSSEEDPSPQTEDASEESKAHTKLSKRDRKEERSKQRTKKEKKDRKNGIFGYGFLSCIIIIRHK